MLGVQNIVNLTGGAIPEQKQAAWNLDQIFAWTALDGTSYVGANLALSFNGANVGVNGMDVAPFPPELSDLYIYAIYNPTTSTWSTLGTISGFGSPIYGGSDMPTDYTASALIWSGKVAQGNFIGFNQVGNLINIFPNGQLWTRIIVPGLDTPLYTSLSLANQIPINSKSVILNQPATAFPGVPLFVAMDASGTGQIVIRVIIGTLSSLTPIPPYFTMALSSPPHIYYIFNTGLGLFNPNPQTELNILGWTI